MSSPSAAVISNQPIINQTKPKFSIRNRKKNFYFLYLSKILNIRKNAKKIKPI